MPVSTEQTPYKTPFTIGQGHRTYSTQQLFEQQESLQKAQEAHTGPSLKFQTEGRLPDHGFVQLFLKGESVESEVLEEGNEAAWHLNMSGFSTNNTL